MLSAETTPYGRRSKALWFPLTARRSCVIGEGLSPMPLVLGGGRDGGWDVLVGNFFIASYPFLFPQQRHHRTAAWVAGLLWRCAACEARRRGCVSLAPLKCRPLHGGTKVLLSWCVGREVGVAAAQKL